MTERAEIVVVGGGIVGLSVAWHLATLGRTDVVVLEKGAIGGGESARAAGMVTQFATSQTMLAWRMYSIELFSRLGLFEHVGSLRVASTAEQLQDMRMSVSRARPLGLACEIISPEAAVRLVPQITAENLHGAVFLPRDGYLDPRRTTARMAELIRELGVTVLDRTRVTGIDLTPRGEIAAVRTDQGVIRTRTVVNAAGLWSPRVAAMAGLDIPTTPVDHQHVTLAVIPGKAFGPATPCVRDPDNLVYTRPEPGGGLLIGGYGLEPHPRWIDGVPWEHGELDVTPEPDAIATLIAGAARRIPLVAGVPVAKVVCHPGAYTPDCQPILGPMPGVRGLWMAAGISLNGYGGAGGIGKLLAEWIIGGEPTQDVTPYKATRFGTAYADPSYAAERTRESVRYYYRLRFPNDEHEWARLRRVSPLHSRHLELGAVFGEKYGWERVNYYEPGRPPRLSAADQRRWGWAKPPYFEHVGREHAAARERAALFDLTSFGKIDVTGPGALPLLQRVSDSNVDKPVGAVVYTQWLNPRGGVEADLTVTRLGPDRFRVVTGAAFVANDLAWLRLHAADGDGEVELRDATNEWACVALWGPRARLTLAGATADPVDDAALPYYQARWITVNGARVLAQRLSYVGELGWELYTAPRHATMVWDRLLAAGAPHGIAPGGYKALDSLRLEKGYRYYTSDVTTQDTPWEAGFAFCVDMAKPDFIGKAALAAQGRDGAARKLRTLTVATDGFTQVYGGEAVWHGGKVVSRVRSGGWGYTVRKNIALTYLPTELAKTGTRVELELIEGRFAAEVTATALHDPKGDRLRA